ncbi:OPT family small oligopeptide transporter [Radiomyces spectabilis]|uniref:OPT family small oligopeptide transporter n=1 Tax=Radiomyces spectabilis TaxID=64574 RepID=UPI0022202129|nr:OPT family small oligopeptide transporter [Radiomyces spectabilis]KAI8394141.1 OPT family small oligopeptide transporter [Radiomyces spectabilis]
MDVAPEKQSVPSYDEKYQGKSLHESDIAVEEHVEDEEDSPIEEVRAVVPNTDDPTMPVWTFRMWFLGLVFSCVLAFVNQFFFYRKNPLQLTPLVIQLITYPIGKVMEMVIPKSRFFNPGPFNIKEHVLITTMANCCYSTAYAVDIITIMKLFYNQDIGWGGGILLIWTTQLIGYGMAGVLRPFLVYPSAMVWPTNLANISLFRSFHIADRDWTGITRFRWFLMIFAGMFVYYWIPGYFFQILTFFSWACWIAPNNRTLAQLTGGYGGMGMLSLSFDWATIASYLSSPMIVPWWAIVNIAVGFGVVAWIIVPAMYYTNVWDAQTFPIITSELFTKTGELWDNSLVLTSENILNETAYQEYGPMRMTPFFAFTYGIMFAGVTSILTHTALYHGKDIIAQFRKARTEDEDIHAKLMRAYKEVPHWWYITVFVISFAVSFAVIYAWPIYLPWWGLILSIVIPIIFTLPIGIIQAITNQQPGLNVLTEFIIGYALPGHPIANVTFKTYGYISMYQSLTFVSDLKLGHYMKIPPRAMFAVQMVGTALAGVINLATARWLMDSIPNICTPAADPFTCPNAKTFYSASVIWGAIGPGKMFGVDSPYRPMLWFFLIGFILPIPFWLLSKKYPNSWVKYVHIPLIFNATGMMPPAMPINFSMWCLGGFISMYYIRKYHHAWWLKYNYVTSAAFDSGVAIATLVIFGVITGSGYVPDWWGNGGRYGDFATPDNCPLAAANATNHCVIC